MTIDDPVADTLVALSEGLVRPVGHTAAGPPALEVRGVNKWFGTNHANRDITVTVARGSIHGIVGENGAGKSTLMNIVYGYLQPDTGEMRLAGRRVRIGSPRDAIRLGIGMVHQHFMLVEPFTVLENVLLGAEGGALLMGGAGQARRKIKQIEQDFGLEVDLDARVSDLPVGLQQRVEILKALYRGADILILDEPTGVLTPQEADHLFHILRALRNQGKTCIIITHKLREIIELTDTVTVMRRGAVVADVPTAETTQEQLAALMVGREVQLRAEKPDPKVGGLLLDVENLTVVDERGVPRVKEVNLAVLAGEIVGIAGVSGNGQTELLEALAGMRPVTSGRVFYKGELLIDRTHTPDPRAIRRAGIAHVPEDRQKVGLVTSFKAYESLLLGYQDERKWRRGWLQRWSAVRRACAAAMDAFDVRPKMPRLKTANFSGGNQQKIILAREIEQEPTILLVGQPTRGVDIGAIEYIHKRLIALRDAGKGILLVSVELDEIMALADRIIVMFDGKIMGELSSGEADDRRIGLMMAGVTDRAA